MKMEIGFIFGFCAGWFIGGIAMWRYFDYAKLIRSKEEFEKVRTGCTERKKKNARN